MALPPLATASLRSLTDLLCYAAQRLSYRKGTKMKLQDSILMVGLVFCNLELAHAQASFDVPTRTLQVPSIDVDGAVYQNLRATLDADGRLTVTALSAPSIPQVACHERQILQTYASAPPPGFRAALAWAQAMTLSETHSPTSTAVVEIDYMRVVEESPLLAQSSQQVVVGEEYSANRAPLAAGEGALWPRSRAGTPCVPGGSSTVISTSRVSSGVLRIDLSSIPSMRPHWWTPRGDVSSGKRHFVEARYRVSGAAAVQFGLDYWRDKDAQYLENVGYDPTCTRQNNCEAWVSGWIGDTQGVFVVRQFPVVRNPLF